MKIYPNQLAQHLQKGLSPVYLIAGDEILMVQEARDQIRVAAKEKGFDEHQFLQVDKSFNWNELTTAANTLSLFSEKSVIELRIPNGKPGRTGSAAIADFLKNPPSDKILLIVTPRLDSSASKGKWVKACETTGIFLPIWPIDRDKFPAWIQGRMRSAGLQADPMGIKFIANNTEGNLLAAAQEIEKLRLIHGKTKLTNEQIAAACGDSARFDIFQLIDQIHLGPPSKIIRVLSRLKEEGGEPVLILWALTREIRTLIKIHTALQRGIAQATCFKQNQIWPKRQSIILRALKNSTPPHLKRLLLKAQQCDTQIKGMRAGNHWDTLMDISLGLGGLKTTPTVTL